MSATEPSEVDILKWLGVIRHPESDVAAQMAASLIVQAFRQLEGANAVLARDLAVEREANQRRLQFRVVSQ